MAFATDDHGYQRVCLNRNNNQTGAIVHRLVIEAFIRKMEPEEEGNHLDFNKKNCALDNLEISTPADNISHATNAGRMAKKLTEENVREIKFSLLWDGDKYDLADKFGVTREAINAITWGKTWRRVDLPSWAAAHD